MKVKLIGGYHGGAFVDINDPDTTFIYAFAPDEGLEAIEPAETTTATTRIPGATHVYKRVGKTDRFVFVAAEVYA